MVEIECKECHKKVEVESRRFKLCAECSRRKQLERCRDYKKKNQENVSKYNKQYKSVNKKELSDYNRTYNLEHREEIQTRQTAQHRKRRETDIQFKISKKLRSSFTKYLNSKRKTIIADTVGCSLKEYKKWIEFNFDENMSWDNYGEYWQIDHVLCIYLFDLTLIDEQKLCFDWKNTRPLNKIKNLGRETLDIRDILNHEIRLHYFEKNNKIGYDHLEYDFAYLTTKLLEKSFSGSS